MYNTDCQILANNIQAQDPIIQAADWRIRPSISAFIDNNTNIQHSCNKIPRQQNMTAHRIAKEAWRNLTSNSCQFTCLNANHVLHCPVRLALVNVCWGDFSLISVNCL
ncbi:hypothetical protein SETIT_9G033000v2 [Setaria italica]|uniref:RNase H type-1 domain-containing protein n=2 Tax=Setaria TaxID=4554 RepID=A0A368SCM3_SETIT|nr:hypothetical protein SETIT_9G033000v2 [Setaria italica]TKV90488.1 hypothetical protein SEVIR_9G032100v2 [Setaria viridis]